MTLLMSGNVTVLLKVINSATSQMTSQLQVLLVILQSQRSVLRFHPGFYLL